MFKYLFFSMAVLLMQNVFAQNPAIKVLDTDFSKGRLTHQQTITLDDAAKFHGHLCDGLVVGFLGLREALYKIYSDSIIDRTNTRIVSKSSPCLTDIAIYLTGGRYQFNTFYVSDSIKYAFIVQRIDNGKTYAVKLKPGIKPAAIDSLGNLANIGKLDACGIDYLHQIENRFLNQLLAANPQEAFIIEEIKNYAWNPIISNAFLKTDIVNKNLQNCLPVKN
jgi:acetolactate decarboxylase